MHPRVLAASVMLSAAAPELHAQASADTVARIDSLFSTLTSVGPGCAIGVGRDGQPALERAYGSANLEYKIANAPTTIFHAASIAKQFTAAAVVRLAELGKLSLDDDVRQFVPELPNYGTKITLNQLIHHTSGLRNYPDLLWLAGGRDDDPLEDDDALAVITRQRELNFAPGSEYLYDNTGYFLLGLVVQRAAGMSLKDFAAQQFFIPFGMTRTQFVDNRFAVIQERATGYQKLRGGDWGHMPYLQDTYGDGGLFTTVGDLLRWYAELPKQPVLYEAARKKGVLNNGDSIPYSAGFELGTYRGVRFIGHGGNAMGENAYAMRFVDRGLAVVVLCNARDIDSFSLARQIAALYLGSGPVTPTTSAKPAEPITLPASQLRKYAGLYYNSATLATRTVVERDSRLFWVRGGPGTPLDAIAPNRFRFPPGQPAELLFPEAPPGQPQEMQVLSGGTVTPYRRAEPFSGSRLADYAGRYASDEVDVTLDISVADSAIVVSTPGSWKFGATPLFKDAFAVPEAAVFEFVRTNGKVSELLVEMQRTRRVRFKRVQ